MTSNLSLTNQQTYQPVVDYWYGAAISSSGQFMVIGNATNPNLYYNNSYGNSSSWFPVNSIIATSVAISSSGQYSVATQNVGTQIYVNTNYGNSNFGTTYTTPSGYTCNTSFNSINSLAMSSTGQYIVSSLQSTTPTTSNIYIYYSSNYGFNWTINTIPVPQTITTTGSIAMSSSGQIIALLGIDTTNSYNYIYYSSNYGNNFTMIYTPPYASNSYVISMNSAGNIIAICPYFDTGNVYVGILTNGIWTFTNTSLDNTYTWGTITMSSSGQYMAVCTFLPIAGGGIFYSSNYGLNWYQLNGQPLSPTNNWGPIRLNSSGQQMIITVNQVDGIVLTGTISLTVPPTLSNDSNSILQNYNNTISNSYINVISPTANNGGGGTINILNLTNGYATNITFNSVNISGNTTNIPLNQIQILQYLNNTSNPSSSLQDTSINIYFSYINGILSIYSSVGVLLNIEVIGSFTYQLPQTISSTPGTPSTTKIT